MSSKDSPTIYTPPMLERIISSLNQKVGSDGTKKFQDDIISSGKFGIFCPISNQIIFPRYNIYIPKKSAVIYFFEAAETLALVSAFTARGSPIVAAITKTNNLMKTDGRRVPSIVMDTVHSALNGLPPSTPKIDSELNSKLICGHKNFAHFIWNELPMIDRALQAENVDIQILKDPFNLTMRHPYSRKLVQVENFDSVQGWNSRLIFMGGSTFLPNTTRSRFLDSIINEKKPKIRRIYITIRPEFINRALINQVDFLSCLIMAFHEKYDDMEFVLDGFSTPEDLHRPIYGKKKRELYSEIVRQSQFIISKIVRAVPSCGNSILDITGMYLSDALEIISGCAFYVCHADSQQNKIAWLFPRNGFVHSNQGRISKFQLGRFASRSECAKIAMGCDSKIVEDVATNWNPIGRGFASKENYIIKDTNSATAQAIKHYSQCWP